MSAAFLIEPDGSVRPTAMDEHLELRARAHHRSLQFRLDELGRRHSDSHARSMARLDGYLTALNAQHTDSFSAGVGLFNPRDLTHRFKRAMEERLPPLTADKFFPINTEVKPGARTYEQHRYSSAGQASLYYGGMGDDVPMVSIGAASINQPVVWFISRVGMDFIESASADFAGIDMGPRKVAAARRVMAERRNNLVWFGDSTIGMYGVLNHPYIDRCVSQVPYTNASDPMDIIDDFGYWASWADNQSSGAYRPDTVIFAKRIHNYLSRTFVAANNGSNVTILDLLKKANPEIKNWEVAPELNNALSSGVHGMVFYAKGQGSQYDHSLEIVDVMSPTLLAPEVRALGQQTFLLACTGGANHTNAGDNLTVYVEGD